MVLFSSLNKLFLGYFDPVNSIFNTRDNLFLGWRNRWKKLATKQWYTSLTLEDSRGELSKVARQCDVTKQPREYM